MKVSSSAASSQWVQFKNDLCDNYEYTWTDRFRVSYSGV
jgi:hypothetical protein